MEINRKKILISCDSSRSLLDFRGKLIEELIRNHDVSIYTPKIDQSRIRHKLDEMGVTVYENELKPSNVSILSDLKYISNLRSLLSKIQPDIFFPYTFKPVIYGVIVAKFCGIKCITPMLTGLGYNFLDLDKKRTLIQKITRILLKFSLKASNNLRVIFQNKDDYHTLVSAKILTAKNRAYVVNGSGVDLSHYDYSKPDLKVISFLMIARLINAKGIKEYYESAKILKQKFPEVRFRLIGPYDDNIDAINNELYSKIKSDGTIEYLGLVQDVRPYITDSSIVVLPSYYGEGVPRCILEGMAMGRAVITSNSVGCKETVNPSIKAINGFLVSIKNVNELTAKMEYYVRHVDDIIRFGVNGRKYAEEKFDVNKVNKQMVQILEGSI
ncbi:glycosyltransferase family 4 protein [Pedobacter frigoris]|uniref:Glycosyltransferase family 4 protein n=1 Tax=Pedobacter frigoris TaxID=2571272 RepID=A0A4U1CGZ5_9SPHI|nr:glycosyltransferase family 4 protein [Pedobacter frigoris]TKC03691.1 glycosyltransferase family 4 protein [Pedobacter frigoris]